MSEDCYCKQCESIINTERKSNSEDAVKVFNSIKHLIPLDAKDVRCVVVPLMANLKEIWKTHK